MWNKWAVHCRYVLLVPVPWGLSRIGARSEGTDDGAGVKTFIVDTGIEVGHEGFRQGNAFWAYTSQGLIRTGNVDKDGHGTHVAGTVAGETTGVAPRAEVRAVKACNADGRCSLSDLIDSVTWVCGLEYRRLQDVTGLARPKVQHGHCTVHGLHMKLNKPEPYTIRT